MGLVATKFRAVPALLLLLLPAVAAAAPSHEARILVGPAFANVLDARQVPYGFLELRPSIRLLGRIGPWLSVEGTGRERFVGVGLFTDVPVGPRWTVTPSVGTGFYSETGGVDLGYRLEFRSTLEVTWRFRSGLAVGASFGHFSNAGFGSANPGSEAVKLVVSVPWSDLPGAVAARRTR